MTLAAWIMLVLTWSITLGFTLRFLWLALRRPDAGRQDSDEQQEP